MAVRLVMEGYLGKEVASMVNVCHQTVSHYMSLFNEGGLELLLNRDFVPGREPFLTKEQQEEIKHLVLTTTPAELDWDISSSWNTNILHPMCPTITAYPFPRSITKALASKRAFLDPADLHIGERRSGSAKKLRETNGPDKKT